MGKMIDISGSKFGRLLVIRRHSMKGRSILWECQCDCGGIRITRAPDLKNGKTLSCGCLLKELLLTRNSRHGMSNTRIYEIWSGMVKRCTNPKAIGWKYYGGRGIVVCEKWLSFEGFYEDMKDGYSDNLSLDRYPDTNGNYELINCRWATEKQQANNRTDNHLIYYNERTQTLAEWCEELNINYKLTENRLRNGWSAENAFTMPKQKSGGNKRTFIKVLPA